MSNFWGLQAIYHSWLEARWIQVHLACPPGTLCTKFQELLLDRTRCGGPVESVLGLVVGRHELLDFGDQLRVWTIAVPDFRLDDDPKLALSWYIQEVQVVLRDRVHVQIPRDRLFNPLPEAQERL